MAQSIHDFHDDPRNAGIRIWINGALKPRAEAVVSVFTTLHRWRKPAAPSTSGCTGSACALPPPDRKFLLRLAQA